MNPLPPTQKPSRFLPEGETWLSVGGPITVLVLVLGLGVGIVYFKKQQWEAFSKAHDCQVLGKMAGDVAPTVGFDAKGTPVLGVAIESGKVGWKCNDGVTYWR